jgi:hypothetical protein
MNNKLIFIIHGGNNNGYFETGRGIERVFGEGLLLYRRQ